MKQKRSHIGCLFWVALILLVLVVFLFNRPRIDQVIKSTGLSNLITKQAPERKSPLVQRSPQVDTKPPVTVEPGPGGGTANPSGSGGTQSPNEPVKSPPEKSTPKSVTKQTVPTRTTPGTGVSTSGGGKPRVVSRQYQLFFVKVDSNGRPVLAATEQTIDFVDSPLTKTFDTLLQGVSSKDSGDGIRTLIPEGTKLLSASVRNGTAYLDFNDRFRFNSYGVEGYNAQLEQVVFTATQFNTVKRVQILLDGKVRKYLAPEGIAIDKPLDRSSFSG